MRDPENNLIKAWAKEYEEAPFVFEQESEFGNRLVAWSEEPKMNRNAFYGLVKLLPKKLAVLVKISAGSNDGGEPIWSRFHGEVDRKKVINVIEQNEIYVFSDGMHQLCLKDPASDRYLAYDDHGIFFVYSPTAADKELFQELGFEQRFAQPIYSMPHFQHVPPNPEGLEMKFISELGIERTHSDLD